MSSQADTTGRLHISRHWDKSWKDSVEYGTALDLFWIRQNPLHADVYPDPDARFEDSDLFRDARNAYRKRINRSWDKEST